ncbi:protein SSUH2 homolog [Mastacembelus armatus]|uniref:Protein SSUH2 homolog n=1 Tax=Mastacembelus armatus TaxID=205130 RepID=A0A3Q3MAU8_9TELE|nr:protein SSUH2 homolog [Mastacembelus armatus]
MDPQEQDGMSPDSLYNNIPGYEAMLSVSTGELCHPPVLSEQYARPEIQSSCPTWEIPSLSKEDALKALLMYASEKTCYSTKPAKEGVITNMEVFDTYRYRLETFTETRTTEWCHMPYYGQTIDTSGQIPPGPWEMEVKTPPFFFDSSETIEVPHTAFVKMCHFCNAVGTTLCFTCSGACFNRCSACHGSGYFSYYPNMQICWTCGGAGRLTCWDCSGEGRLTCSVCSGKRKIKVSINLVVNWLNSIDEDCVELSSGLQMFKLRSAPGISVFTDSNYMVYPVTYFPNPTIAQISERLLKEHRERFSPTSRTLQQRQTIEVIPVTKVTYEWKEESHVFFVYGTDGRVSADDYPATCCGCCPLM